MIQIKNIKQEQAEGFWKLRLEALRTHPEAFYTSYEDSVQTPLDEVAKRIMNKQDDYILGAFKEDGQIVGMVGFKRGQGMKFKHKGMIWGIYVAADYRGKGIAKELLQEVLRRGKDIEGLKQINLSVVTANKVAAGLYKILGFETYGTEKNALEYNGRGYDEEYMTYYLR
ncbi:GNAT family N-acetyltransferase [Paenibacillus lentus]|uniref:GNAT family N-acetyltransferase n=1 Tax=Paenibacillus lentus TaxID=1338368 RepID=A0A3S8RQT8_9BACL|nr:GNAT family N-acetyltransferase [Paenibacillus lentus]AZK45183.1 GNAT family N-acetyltransferase [Paenibacillus lentus]